MESANKNYKCEICDKEYDKKCVLKTHFDRIHNNKGKVFECNICSKKFQITKALHSHIEFVHSGKKITNVTPAKNLLLKH